MSESNASSHIADLNDLLDVLTGKKSEDAVLATQEFVRKHPERSEGYFILGVLTYLSGYVGDALGMVERAHNIDPDVREYAQALASLYAMSDRINDALYFAKLGVVLESDPDMAGILPPALMNFIETVGSSELHQHYVSARLAFNRRDYFAAKRECEFELKMSPTYAPAIHLLGKVMTEVRDFGGAISCFQKMFEIGQGVTCELYLDFAFALVQLGLFDQAISQVQLVMDLPDVTVSEKVRICHIMELVPDRYNDDVDKYRKALDEALGSLEPYFEYNKSVDGKIRIGFVTNECHQSFEGKALQQIVKKIDPQHFECFVYFQNIYKDSLTQDIKNRTVSTRPIYDVNDKTLSLILNRDQIDILVDMTGYGPGSRAELIARKPCGLHLSWLVPSGGAGQNGVEYVLTDRVTNDAQSKLLAKDQQTLMLDAPILSTPVIQGYVDVGEPPCLKNGYITFGLELNLLGLSQGEAELWAKLLSEHPKSILRINVGTFMSDLLLARINELFEPLGILDRISLYSPDDQEQLGVFYRDVDIYLASAYERPETVVEALWMGVPCLARTTHQNAKHVGLAGAVIRAAGIPKWLCEDEESFHAMVSSLANDPGELSGLRNVLRYQLTNSALMNSDGFVMDVMNQFGNLFSVKFD